MPQPKKSSSSSRKDRTPAQGRSPSKRASSSAKGKTASKKSAASARKPAAGKQAGAPRKTPAGPPSSSASGVALRDALTDPVGAVLLTRARIQETFDEAVQRGHITRQAANDMAEALLRRSRREAQDILADLEQIVGRSRSGLEAAGKRARSSAADRAAQHVDRARRVTGIGGALPIPGYDDLTAAQITERLEGLSPADLRKVRDYERRHGNRKSVLGAVERKLT
jgi:polyhydroxyalkanoate synthesis regulator phasin